MKTIDVIEAKLASKTSGQGHFSVVQEGGMFSVREWGGCQGGKYESAAEARAEARRLADQHDRRKIEDLKAQWRADGSWDIEDTEGFEAFRQEIYIFRLEIELAAAKNREEHLRSVLAPFAALLKEVAPIGSPKTGEALEH